MSPTKEEQRRIRAIKLKQQGYTVREIAKILGVGSYSNVQRWITKYDKNGLDALKSKRNNSGRKSEFRSEKNLKKIKTILEDAFTKTPADFELVNDWVRRDKYKQYEYHMSWTYQAIADLLMIYFPNKKVTESQAYYLIQKLGLENKRYEIENE